MEIDTGKLRADLAALGVECRALKKVLGETWVKEMATEQRTLARLRARVTELCVLTAFSRGRVHVLTAPRPIADSNAALAAATGKPMPVWDRAGWHAAIAARVAKGYPRGAEVVVAEASER